MDQTGDANSKRSKQIEPFMDWWFLYWALKFGPFKPQNILMEYNHNV